MVKLRGRRMIENRTDDKLGSTALKTFEVNFLGLRQYDPIRNFKNAGVIQIHIQQHIQVHSPYFVRRAKLSRG